MAKKSGFAKAQASVLKAIRNFEETVSGMVGFDEQDQRAKRKTKKTKTKKRKSKNARGR